jgi:MinD-like ATPase involved in chromosome partitioning or flagellar assembly
VNGQARGLLAPPPPPPAAPWIAVTGGKGGVGKTLVAVNLALTLTRLGHETLLVDLDPGLGNVDVHLRLAAPFDVEHLAEGACAPRDAVVDGPGRLRVLLGRSGSPRLAAGDRDYLGRALDGVARAARGADVVVCDTGAGIGPAVLDVVARARLALAVTTPDPAAVTDAYALCKVLLQRGVPLPRLVVNRAGSPAQARAVAERLGAVCQQFLRQPLLLLGSLAADPALERSVAEQRPAALRASGTLADSLRRLAVGVVEACGGLPSRGRRPPPAFACEAAQLGAAARPMTAREWTKGAGTSRDC